MVAPTKQNNNSSESMSKAEVTPFTEGTSATKTQPEVTPIDPFTFLDEMPVSRHCPFCHAKMVTRVTYKAGTYTYKAMAGIALGAFPLGIVVCWLPLVWKDSKDAVHSCPACDRLIVPKQRHSKSKDLLQD